MLMFEGADRGDVIFGLLPIVVLVAVFIRVRAIFRARDQRLPDETAAARREEYCGGVVDLIHWYTKPALRLSLYDGHLVLKGLHYVVSLDYRDITSVAVTRVLVKQGVMIRHRRQDAAANIVLFCDDNAATVQAIRGEMVEIGSR
jgi:hypothetical protein